MYPFHILSEDYDYGAILVAGIVCVDGNVAWITVIRKHSQWELISSNRTMNFINSHLHHQGWFLVTQSFKPFG